MEDQDVHTESVEPSVSRRTMLAGAGATALTAALAGCQGILSDGETANTGGEVPDEPIQAGLQTLLEGPGAVFGEPGLAGAELAIERINEAGGVAGREIVLEETVNEGSPIENYERFVDLDLDVSFGPVSSAGHAALAPVVEENGLVNIALAGNGTDIFYEDVPDPEYAFRTSSLVVMQDLGAVLTSVERLDQIDTVAGVNPNYDAGQQSWEMFIDMLSQFTDFEVVYEGFPELLADDYSTHITQVNDLEPDVTHSILWGGDIVTFMEQAVGSDMFENTTLVSNYLVNQFNDVETSTMEAAAPNVLCGSRNAYWEVPPHDRYQPMRDFVADYRDQTGNHAPQFSYMEGYMALTCWSTAVEKAVNILGGWPSQEQIAAALEGHSYYTPFGYHHMRPDHNGVSPEHWGVLGVEDGEPTINDRVQYSTAEIAPPPGISGIDEWIGTWEL